jgi:hypothetical protein
MKTKPNANAISEAVVAYCEAIDVPDFDEAAIASSSRVGFNPIARWRMRPRVAAYVASFVVLLAILYNVPTVVAGVQRVFAAFTVASARRTTPMTIQEVNLDRARVDMPFTVIVPPSIAGAEIVAIDEVYSPGSPSDASVIFEIHGSAAGPEAMIVENAARHHSPTLFALRDPANATALPPFHSFGTRPLAAHKPILMLREDNNARTFSPASWVTHGTRVVVMSRPGLLSISQLRAMKRAMSR